MRFIVYGVGAIGGTVAAALTHAGKEVVGIARGEQLRAVRQRGLTLKTPEETYTSRFSCVETPDAAMLRPDDVILICTKTQHTTAVLDQLAAAGAGEQAIFCLQNGVENERLALRRFANVHAVAVMLPADFVTPGEVAAFGMPNHGLLYIGRFPGGSDDRDRQVAEALTHARIASFVDDDVMKAKYGKLLLNLHNIVDAAIGRGPESEPVSQLLRREAEAVLSAANIAWRDVGTSHPQRAELMRITPIEGVARTGSSSAQSLARSAGSIETDYLNGEIVLLGRLHGVPTPANAWFCELAARMIRENREPGSVRLEEVASALGL